MIRESATGRSSREAAVSMNNLARVYERLGRYDDAEALHRRDRDRREGRGRHRELAVSEQSRLIDLKSGRRQAEPLLVRALDVREKALGPSHPDVAQSLNNLSVAYRQLGRAAEGEPLLKRAIAIKEQIFGPDHPEVAFHLIALATA
jgi:tetratricopeptide (TPR) repeat protein